MTGFPVLFTLDMEQEEKWKLLKMIIRYNKTKKHKPRKVLEPQLSIGGVESPLFVDSEVQNTSYGRLKTDHLRHSMLRLVDEN